MDSFTSFTLRKLYQKIHKLGDRLAKIEPLIDWEAFRPILRSLYDNQGARPELERQANDRISFHRFLARAKED